MDPTTQNDINLDVLKAGLIHSLSKCNSEYLYLWTGAREYLAFLLFGQLIIYQNSNWSNGQLMVSCSNFI